MLPLALNVTQLDVAALRVVLDLKQRETETPDEWKTRGVLLCYHVLGLVQYLPGCQPVPSQVGVGVGQGPGVRGVG